MSLRSCPCPLALAPAPRGRLLLVLLPALGLAGACDGADRPLFEEVGEAAGVAIPLVCGGSEAKATILEVNGNGAALSDLDGDGDLDIVLVDGTTREDWVAGATVRHHLLRNDGPTGGVPRFSAVTSDHGLAMSGWPTGVAAGDVDADGRPDLLIGGLGEDALFLNRTEPGGPIRFEKRALPGRDTRYDWTTSVALADADGDGRLDAYLVRYLFMDPADPPIGDLEGVPCRFGGLDVLCGPQGLPPQPDVFLRGAGDGTFEVATAAAGLDAPAPAYGLGVAFADLTGDGHPDVYVANDSVDNFLLVNRGDGTFEDRSTVSGAAASFAGRAQAGMGVSLGDVDADGRFDLAVTNFSDETNALYRQDGQAMFRDVNARAGLANVSRPMLGWGVQLADFDADGRLDLFVANGHVFPEMDRPDTGTSYAQKQQLFPGRGDGTFGADVFPDSRRHKGRAALAGDLDGDGDLDLLVLTLDGAPLLYVNRTDEPSRELLVTLADRAAGDNPGAASVAFGATLSLRTAAGVRLGQALSSSSFQASPDPRVHMSFGSDDGEILEASVLWPGGEVEKLDPGAMLSGRRLLVVKGRGVVSALPLESVP